MDLVTVILVIAAVLLFAALAAALWLRRGAAVDDPTATYYRGGAAEVEARFLNVEPEELRKKLRDLGGEQVYARRKFRRNVYGLHGRGGYARVRDEGDKVTMTVKTYENPKYPEEKEVVVNADFDSASAFLGGILEHKAYQETYREKWSLPGCNEVVIDNVPGFLPYCEIECDDEEQLKAAAAKLGFDWAQAHFGAFGTTFEEFYGISRKYVNDELRVLKFDSVGAELGDRVVKNKDIFNRAIEYGKDLA